MSYAEATMVTIKYSVDSPQDCVEVTRNSEVSGIALRTGLPRATGFSHLTEVTGSMRKSDMMSGPQPHIFIPCRIGVHISNNPVDWKCTEDKIPMKRLYMGVAVMCTRVAVTCMQVRDYEYINI